MKLRNTLIVLLSVVCFTAWWQVETRLSAARNLNMNLSVEAAFLMEIHEDKPNHPEFMPTPPAWDPAANDRMPTPAGSYPSPDESGQETRGSD
jgi:hypothetical protein